jgi:hypothetical protein
MIVIESNSQQFPTKPWIKQDGDTVVTIKWPTQNTDILAGRHISSRRFGPEFPFLCYHWCPEIGAQGGKWDHISRDNLTMCDWEKWDEHYRSFGPDWHKLPCKTWEAGLKHPEPSSGTCAVYSVVECYNPDRIGLIGFDYVLDNNTDWMHDAKAELASIESVVDIVDLRTPRQGAGIVLESLCSN